MIFVRTSIDFLRKRLYHDSRWSEPYRTKNEKFKKEVKCYA